MDQSQLKWIADFIWNIADDRLRDVYVRGKYRDVILPFTVLRRLDAVLEATKDAVLERKKFLDSTRWPSRTARCAWRQARPSITSPSSPSRG
jgi:type I restriction-modification system DNA methylase subunit